MSFSETLNIDAEDTASGGGQGSLQVGTGGEVRSTHILVTLKRDELIREGRGEELDELVKATRELQDSLIEPTGA